MILVLDNTVMSNFAHIERIDLLANLWPGKLITARAAWDELQAGIESGRVPSLDWSWLQVFDLTAIETARCTELIPPLDIGEAACLALAHMRNFGLLTDDRVARREARRLGAPLSGTIGVLRSLVDDGIISLFEANGLLQQMVAIGYHSPVNIV